ncbi:outer membrane beta-barrel protein [Flavobacterium sp. SUN052]|uniref:TonB-dependent receptor n=1 Tax=Flavobacterium sp. SUN052 TaxID=3002441 RepID=UPI00237E5882|nr:TonB-dependent receptor [Flavobacterium sp. SUN052]MEC4005483.1 outer membrane beta-barrel protein [Flavobacterium sp. SUN052]
MKFIFTLILFSIVQISFCQNATIKGSVLDDSNASPLPGVNIIIRAIKFSTTSDSDGKFIFRNVKPGTYDVEFTFIGYKPKVVSEVIVVANETTELNTTLEEVKNTLDEVVITKTKAKAESVKSLLTMQKNNASVSDGISAETIKKTPDRTTSDVLKRISGASVQDNKFVIIRGLNDRYNVALLNGAPLPSSEPDRKAFSFDIFPSNILDNLIITKTASPDLPGEFAGGVVQINTKSVPDKDFQSISVGSGYNTITTFKEQKTYAGSKTDWIGYDNGVRNLPSSIPDTENFNTLTYQEKAQLAKTFEYDWNINNQKFQPNTNFQYSIGRHINFKEKVLGLLFSLSNNKSNTFSSIQRIDYDNADPNIPSVVLSKFDDNNYTEQVLTAGLANFSFKFNQNHSITFKNVYSINSTDLVVERYGQKDVNDTRFITANVRWFTSNKIYSGQINGEHYFPHPKIKVNWNGFYSDIKRSIPNLRRNIYSISDPNSIDPAQNTPVAEIASNTGGPDYGGGMFFSENKENINGGKLDVSKKFTIGENLINEVKVGGLVQFRERDFFSRQLQYNKLTLGGTFDENLLLQPNSTIFNISNMGVISPGVNGFTLGDYTKFTDSYTAGSDLKAAYLMLDNRFKKFRLVWGVRIEDYVQRIDSRLTEIEYLSLNERQTDILPSVNLICSINKKQNLRLSYSITLNRPEFRELAPFGFYDFTTQFFTQGNPELKIAEIKNWDFRYELYPGKGQILSFSYFRKNFTNPIEIQQEVNNKTVTYRNAKSALNSGIEFEFRTLLSSILGTKIPFFEDITVYSNIAIIKSQVDVSNFNSANTDQSRPLQGQSPYIFNGGIQYGSETNGWSISANVNRAGNRIAFTDSEVKPAIWEKARTFIDMQITKSFNKKKFEAKINIQNILAQDLIFYQNNYKNTDSYGTLETLANSIFTGDYHYEDGYSKKDDDVLWRSKFGRSFSLSLTYNF